MRELIRLCFAVTIFINTVYSQDTINVPTQYRTIQQAIDGAAEGDMVIVSEGIYTENINFRGKAITLASRFILDKDTSFISSTIINGSKPQHTDSGSAVTFNSGETASSVICGFTITGGTGTLIRNSYSKGGGGILCDNSSATITDNIVTLNSVTNSLGTFGGGIAIVSTEEKAYSIVQNNLISENHCESFTSAAGGGLFIMQNGQIINNVIENNTVYYLGTDNGAAGGGICGASPNPAFNTMLIVRQNLISGNKVFSEFGYGGWGGGADFWRVQLDFQMNKITGNSVGAVQFGYGVGMRLLYCRGNTLIKNNEFVNNIPEGQMALFGGGLLILSDSITVEANRFIQNKSDHGAGIYLQICNGVIIQNNYFFGNDALIYGGALYSALSDYTFQNNILVENTAGFGGALSLESNTTWNKTIPGQHLEKLTFSMPVFGNGPQLSPVIYSTGLPVILNNTIVNNYASRGGAVSSSGSGSILLNNIIWGNAAAYPESQIYETGNPLLVYYNNIQGGYGGEGNINSQPCFIQSDSLFHINDNSPCRNNGIDSIQIYGNWIFAPARDYDGEDRVDKADIGADEWHQNFTPVQLISFTGEQINDRVLLKWSTAGEINNFGFEVQRKTEGDFLAVGFIKGNGNSTELNEYYFMDNNIVSGKNIYRLKQADFNGQFEYSSAVELEIKPAGNWFLGQNYPNPFNPSTTIAYGIKEKSEVIITILNALGERVAVLLKEEKEPGIYTINLNASGMSSGIYFYQLHSGGFSDTKKFIVIK